MSPLKYATKQRYKHYAKRFFGAASGAAIGYLYRNLPGAYAGAKSMYNYVGPYKPQGRLASNRKWLVGSNKGKITGSRAYHKFRSNPDPRSSGGGSGTNPPKGTKRGAFKWGKKGWKYVGGSFGIRRQKRGHRGKSLVSRNY